MTPEHTALLEGIANNPRTLNDVRVAVLGALGAASAVQGIADDYMTSEQHHPGYVLIPAGKFEQLRQADAETAQIEREAGECSAFQERVQPWLLACFGEMIAGDREERNHRFLEEALELVQACGCTVSEAHQLVDYVFAREVGDPPQEVGGVMVTLAALCLANGLDMHANAETELARVWTKVEAIRAKQAAKPKHSPLPQHVPTLQTGEPEVAIEAAARAMCDRVNGIGDYDENVAQRRPGWTAQARTAIKAYLAEIATSKDPAA